jgi:hypothetical protein
MRRSSQLLLTIASGPAMQTRPSSADRRRRYVSGKVMQAEAQQVPLLDDLRTMFGAPDRMPPAERRSP